MIERGLLTEIDEWLKTGKCEQAEALIIRCRAALAESMSVIFEYVKRDGKALTAVASPSKAKPDIEFVLPSGRFARMRHIVWNDLVLAGQYMENPILMVTLIACQCTTIDDVPLDLKTISQMSPDEASPICNKVSEMVKQLKFNTKGIA